MRTKLKINVNEASILRRLQPHFLNAQQKIWFRSGRSDEDIFTHNSVYGVPNPEVPGPWGGVINENTTLSDVLDGVVNTEGLLWWEREADHKKVLRILEYNKSDGPQEPAGLEYKYWDWDGWCGAGIYFKGVCCRFSLTALAHYCAVHPSAQYPTCDAIHIFEGHYVTSCGDGEVVQPTRIIGQLPHRILENRNLTRAIDALVCEPDMRGLE